jgi:hypothetical protein
MTKAFLAESIVMETDEVGYLDLTSLAQLLVCPECLSLLLPPTSICERGHTFCRLCSAVLEKCPACEGEFLEHARNIPVEEICKLVGHKCPYSESGCNYTLTEALLPLHASECCYRKVDCPLNKVPNRNCSWSGVLKGLESHLKNVHGDMISVRNYIMSNVFQNDAKIILHKGETFIFLKYLKGREWFAIIQRAGCTKETFKCVFRICSPKNKIGFITMTFTVTNINESTDDVFEEGRSMILDDIVVKNFVEGDDLSMMVAVEETK